MCLSDVTMGVYVTFQRILVIVASSQRFSFFLLLPITKFINGVFPVSRDVLAISRLFSSCIYKAARIFLFIQRVKFGECSSEKDRRV